MQSTRFKLAAGIAAAGILATAGAALAGDRPAESTTGGSFRASLTSYQEVPAVSSPGADGSFRARVNRDGDEVRWELRYDDLEGAVQQAHIHLGQRAVNGGVSVFLCSNLPGAPQGTQPCPAPPARVRGTFGAGAVIGPAAQGIAPGELAELLRAMRAGVTYANVHSEAFPGGNVRGQIRRR